MGRRGDLGSHRLTSLAVVPRQRAVAAADSTAAAPATTKRYYEQGIATACVLPDSTPGMVNPASLNPVATHVWIHVVGVLERPTGNE